MIVTKMPANSFATSRIGSHEKPLASRFVRRQPKRGQCDQHEHGITQDVLQRDLGAIDVERDAGFPDRRAEDGRDDECDQREVDEAVDLNGDRLVAARGFVAREPCVEREEHHEEWRGHDERLKPDMFQRPEEFHAAQEADEQRRIAERRERAADIGDQDDEKDHNVDIVSAAFVRLEQRADQDHGGAGGADGAGDQCADRKQRRVDQRRAAQIAGDENAARRDVEREQQDDEGEIFGQGRVHEGGGSRRHAVERGECREGQHAPQ
jgi:hypothetical protein